MLETLYLSRDQGLKRLPNCMNALMAGSVRSQYMLCMHPIKCILDNHYDLVLSFGSNYKTQPYKSIIKRA